MKSGGKPRNLKQNNTRIVLDVFRRGGELSVAGISGDIKISKTTVKKICDNLLSMGLVHSAGKGDSTDEGGKKPELYRFNKDYGYVIGLHITPEALISVTTDLDADITWLRKTDIGADRGIESIMDRLVGAIRGFTSRKAASGQVLIGIALVLPGLVDSARGVSIYSPHYHEWGRDLPFAEMLSRRLGADFAVPLYVDNANRYQAIAETRKGVASGCGNFCIVDALSEGLGSGIVLNGELVQGIQSISGELGHMTLDPYDGFPCICGHKGCFEAMVSARRVLGLAIAAKDRFPGSCLFASRDGDRAFTLVDVCEGAVAGDALCRSLIDDVSRWFLIGLGNVIMVNDPELIVLQGVYVKAGDYFLGLLKEGIRHIGLPVVEKKVRIEYSVMGEERGVIGGAAYIIEEFFGKQISF